MDLNLTLSQLNCSQTQVDGTIGQHLCSIDSEMMDYVTQFLADYFVPKTALDAALKGWNAANQTLESKVTELNTAKADLKTTKTELDTTQTKFDTARATVQTECQALAGTSGSGILSTNECSGEITPDLLAKMKEVAEKKGILKGLEAGKSRFKHILEQKKPIQPEQVGAQQGGKK